jgi:hypothetical protein
LLFLSNPSTTLVSIHLLRPSQAYTLLVFHLLLEVMVRERHPSIIEESSDDDTYMEEVEEDSPPRPQRQVAAKKKDKGKGKAPVGPSKPKPMKRKSTTSKGKGKGKGKQAAPLDSDDDISPPPPNAPLIEGLVVEPAQVIDHVTEGPKRSIDWSKGKSKEIKRKRYQNPLEWNKDPYVRDIRFHNEFQADYYNTVILGKKNQRVLEQRFVNWEGCLALHDRHLTKALAILEKRGLKNIMTMRYDWNEEVIAQFYATLWITKVVDSDEEVFVDSDEEPERKIPNVTLHFLIQGEHYKCSYKRFARILGFGDEDLLKDYIHDSRKPTDDEALILHVDENETFWKTTNVKPTFRYMNSLIRQTVLPKGGNEMNILSHNQTLLLSLADGTEFSTFDMIWSEIVAASSNTTKSCLHAPYLMKMIEVVTKLNFKKESKHQAYIPLRIDPRDPYKRTKRSRGSTSAAPQSPSPPRQVHPPRSRSSRGGSSSRSGRDSLASLVKRGFRTLFHMCRTTQQDVVEIRRRQALIDARQKKMYEEAKLQPPLSPPYEYEPPAPLPETWYEYDAQVFGNEEEEVEEEEEEIQEDSPPPHGTSQDPHQSDWPSWHDTWGGDSSHQGGGWDY